MPALIWGSAGQRFFETGTDRGVLFPKVGSGVPWNGLISVTESPSGGEPRPYYYDGFKYLNVATAEEFEASIDAYSAPSEFDKCDGTASIHHGLFVTQQPRESFGFSYRTKIGNDLQGTDHGYKIHLVYNALAGPAQRDYATIGDSVEPLTFTWDISTAPVDIPGFRPSAHFVIDSRRTPKVVMEFIEGIIYGSDSTTSRLPSAIELIELFESFLELKAFLVETNVYQIQYVDGIDRATAVMRDTPPPPGPDGHPLLWFDTSPNGYATLHLIT